MRKKHFLVTIMFLLAVLCVPGLSWSGSGHNTTGSTATATSEQFQGMQQSQIVYGNSGESAEIPRTFPNPATPNYPGVGNYWGAIFPDGRFDVLANTLQYKATWTMADAEKCIRSSGGKIEVSVPEVSEGTVPSRAITFLVLSKPPQKPQRTEDRARYNEELARYNEELARYNEEQNRFNQEYVFITRGTILAKNRSTTAKVFGHAIKEGLRQKADVALYDEGFGLRLDAQSIGINIQGTLSVVSGGAGTGIGGVSGGGTGWVNAWAEYYAKPWLKVSYFKRRTLAVAPSMAPLAPPAPVADPVERGGGTIYRPNYAPSPEFQGEINSGASQGGKLGPPVAIQR